MSDTERCNRRLAKQNRILRRALRDISTGASTTDWSTLRRIADYAIAKAKGVRK